MAEDKFGHDPEKLNLRDFNDHSKGTVFYRNLQADVLREPLLIKADVNSDGSKSYLVHEDRGYLTKLADFVRSPLGESNEGELKRYSEKAFNEKFGKPEDMRTFEQYSKDYAVLKETPGLGRNLDYNKDTMGFRIKEINNDLAQAGETLAPRMQGNPVLNLP